MTSALIAELEAKVAGSGINLIGLADAALFDLCQPRGRRSRELMARCETILVLGTGGRGFWNRLADEAGPMPARPPLWREPLRKSTQKIARQVSHWLGKRGFGSALVDPESCRTLNFVQLGEAAGLGTISPVTGFLLHPRYGPWVSMRAAILLPGYPFGCDFKNEVASSFQPCLGCEKPCVTSCPIGVYDGEGVVALEDCASHLHRGGCGTHCASRRACPVGADERYDEREETYRHSLGIRLLRRCFGLGLWRFVPCGIRKN